MCEEHRKAPAPPQPNVSDAEVEASFAAVEAAFRGPNIHLLLEGFEREIEAALAHHSRPRGGQQVPFHGDFVNVSVSGLIKMKWWLKAFREAL
jgi:hypothetical protein